MALYLKCLRVYYHVVFPEIVVAKHVFSLLAWLPAAVDLLINPGDPSRGAKK